MSDKIFMQKTLDLAAKGRGKTSPNPMVGAVIVKGGKIIAQGYHQKAGRPHAEIIALKKFADLIGKKQDSAGSLSFLRVSEESTGTYETEREGLFLKKKPRDSDETGEPGPRQPRRALLDDRRQRRPALRGKRDPQIMEAPLETPQSQLKVP